MRLLKGILTSVGPRVISAIAAMISAKAAEKLGITLNPEEVAGGMLVVYAGVHKAISSKVNPGDGAKLRVNEAIKEATESKFVDTVKIAGTP